MANIILRLTTGSTSDTSSGANSSLGGAMGTDTNAIITTSNSNLNNLFDNISKLENSDGMTDYRCIMVHNDTASIGEIFASGSVFLSGSTKADIEVGFDVANANAAIIANETQAPSGITFSKPTDIAPLLFPGDIVLDIGDYVGLWIKRTAQNISGAGTITDVISLVVRGVE